MVYLTENVAEAREANERGDSRLTYKILRDLKPYRARRASSVLDEDGLPTRDPPAGRASLATPFVPQL